MNIEFPGPGVPAEGPKGSPRKGIRDETSAGETREDAPVDKIVLICRTTVYVIRMYGMGGAARSSPYPD